MLKAENLSYRVGKKYLLEDTTTEFSSGHFHAIMGANGAGKTTLLKLLAGEMISTAGNIYMFNKTLSSYSKKELAMKRAVLSQNYHVTFPISVSEIILMGRYPYYLNNPSSNDLSICKKVMEMMDITELAERDYTSLSGGEAQKAQMCRVLAQIWTSEQGEEKILFLDEPVSHLDVKYQHQLLSAAKELCRNKITVIAILHDINLALRYADSISFMKAGKIVHETKQLSDVTSDVIREVFGVSSTIIYPDQEKPVVIF